jgi:hypothetical protein
MLSLNSMRVPRLCDWRCYLFHYHPKNYSAIQAIQGGFSAIYINDSVYFSGYIYPAVGEVASQLPGSDELSRLPYYILQL